MYIRIYLYIHIFIYIYICSILFAFFPRMETIYCVFNKIYFEQRFHYAFFPTFFPCETFTFSPLFSKPRGATAQIAFDFVKNNSLTYAEATFSGGNPWLGVVDSLNECLGE